MSPDEQTDIVRDHIRRNAEQKLDAHSGTRTPPAAAIPDHAPETAAPGISYALRP